MDWVSCAQTKGIGARWVPLQCRGFQSLSCTIRTSGVYLANLRKSESQNIGPVRRNALSYDNVHEVLLHDQYLTSVPLYTEFFYTAHLVLKRI